MLNSELYLFWCGYSFPIHTDSFLCLWRKQVSWAYFPITTVIGESCYVYVCWNLCVSSMTYLKKIKNMWEKSLFIIYGHISIFSCLWGTFGEEIKKKTIHRWGKKMSLDVKIQPSKSKQKKTYNLCVCLCEFNHYLWLNK